MPPSGRKPVAPPALTDEDVTQLRERVAAGESPRVVVRAASASVAAGTRGSVIRLGSPKDNEYIVVRLGRDEVPFAPIELGIPGRKAPKPPKAANPRAERTTRPTRSSRAPRTPEDVPRRVPSVVVTMRFRDSAWTIEVQRGSKQLCQPAPLPPGAIAALAEHIENESVQDALVETVDACRAIVAEQAAALRAELERAEATLRAYDARPARARKS